VLGGAACVWRDIESALQLGEYYGVVAANDIGASWPGPLDAICSLHEDKLRKIWLVRRARAGLPPPKLIATKASHAHQFEGQKASGSSGLFALKLTLVDLRFDRAVLCGIPMDGQPHFFGGDWWGGAKSHKRGWQQALPAIRDRARSLSGWTADLLGRPTAEWVAGEQDH
jgi:hypothetical protein